MSTSRSKKCIKSFDVVIHEVLVHTTTIEAPSEAVAIRRALADWNQHGVDMFSSQTLGRTDMIRATVVRV